MAYATSNALPEEAGQSFQTWNGSTVLKVCIELPPNVNSDGIWDYIQHGYNIPLEASLPRLELQLIGVLSLTQALHCALKRIGLPMFVSQCLAGLILGRTVLGQNEAYSRIMLSYHSQEIIDTMAGFSFGLSLFLLGIRLDVSLVLRTGKRTFFAGVAAFLIPLICGLVAVEQACRLWHLNADEEMKLIVIAVIHSASVSSVIANLLIDLHIINSEIGRLGLSTAMVCEMLSLFVTGLIILLKAIRTRTVISLVELSSLAVYVILVVFVFRPAMNWVVRETPVGRPVKNSYTHAVILGALASSILSIWFSKFIFVGPLVFGLAVPDGPPLGSAVLAKLDNIINGVVFPLFITTCTMKANLFDLGFDANLMKSTIMVVAVITIVKFIASMVPSYFCNMPIKDTAAFGLMMCCKGIMEMGTYVFCADNGVITRHMFDLLILVILVTRTIVTIIVKWLYDPSRIYAGYQKRNIMHSKPNSELPILACIYKPSNIPTIVNFVEALGPSTQRPLALYVLHLIELCGTSVPLFISHQWQTKKTVSVSPYSENVVISFKLFQEENEGIAHMNAFTAISPSKFMHEDICLLALDKLTSLILLPFHGIWSVNGFVESQDSNTRALNCSVLERAPCSVGILIDRGYPGQLTSRGNSKPSSFSIAMIFFGGSDDREALTLAKHMSQDTRAMLTVLRFIDKNDKGGTDWEKMLDSEVLREIKPREITNPRVKYKELVADGQEAASVIEGTVDKFDFIIVGRRHKLETSLTSDLANCNKFPELGVVGNFLVSANHPYTNSILVVQQQQTV